MTDPTAPTLAASTPPESRSEAKPVRQSGRAGGPLPVRVAVRAVLKHEGKLLLVNAWRAARGQDPDRILWCAPGGGAEPHSSLPENLIREVHEETGLLVDVGAPCLVNEFHDPKGSFHQVDIYFHCSLIAGNPNGVWTDPEGVVSQRRWVSEAEFARLRVKPDALGPIAFGGATGLLYDPLEPLQRR